MSQGSNITAAVTKLTEKIAGHEMALKFLDRELPDASEAEKQINKQLNLLRKTRNQIYQHVDDPKAVKDALDSLKKNLYMQTILPKDPAAPLRDLLAEAVETNWEKIVEDTSDKKTESSDQQTSTATPATPGSQKPKTEEEIPWDQMTKEQKIAQLKKDEKEAEERIEYYTNKRIELEEKIQAVQGNEQELQKYSAELEKLNLQIEHPRAKQKEDILKLNRLVHEANKSQGQLPPEKQSELASLARNFSKLASANALFLDPDTVKTELEKAKSYSKFPEPDFDKLTPPPVNLPPIIAQKYTPEQVEKITNEIINLKEKIPDEKLTELKEKFTSKLLSEQNIQNAADVLKETLEPQQYQKIYENIRNYRLRQPAIVRPTIPSPPSPPIAVAPNIGNILKTPKSITQSTKKFLDSGKKAAGTIKRFKSLHKVGRALKKGIGNLFKKGLSAIGKLSTRGIPILGQAMLAKDVVGLINKYKKQIAIALGAITGWLLFQLSAFLSAILSSWMALVGAGIGFIVGGIPGAVAGAALGYAAQNWITRQWGSLTKGASEMIHNAVGQTKYLVDSATGQIVGVTETGVSGILSGATVVPAAMVGVPLAVTFGSAAFFTFFAAMHLMVAFTVPNPVGTQSIYPGYYGPPGTGPGGPAGGGGTIPRPAPPNSSGPGSLGEAINNAAELTCVPAALIAAVLQTESGAYNDWDTDQFQKFSQNQWWENADDGRGNTVNCYNGHYTWRNGFGTQSNYGSWSECQQGYCYDTCTETGTCGGQARYIEKHSTPVGSCASLPGEPCESFASTNNIPGIDNQICPLIGTRECTEYDVYGVAQFLRTTFYGDNCAYRDGTGPSCNQSHYATIAPLVPHVPNRCNAQDIILGNAAKLHSDAAVPEPSGQCTFNQSHWTKDRICETAKSYCGSCGKVQYPNHGLFNDPDGDGKSNNPCASAYTDPSELPANPDDMSNACGGWQDRNGNWIKGYCDKVYDLYVGSP